MEEATLASTTQAHIDRAFAAFEASQLHGLKDAARQVQSQMTWHLNHRLRTLAGKARWRINRIGNFVYDMKIEFNADAFSRIDAYEQYITVTHEIAHLIDVFYYKESNDHGYKWREIDTAMGGNGARCHNIPSKRNTVKRFKLQDGLTGKVYNNVTLRTLNNCNRRWPGRYKVLEEKILNDTPESLLSA